MHNLALDENTNDELDLNEPTFPTLKEAALEAIQQYKKAATRGDANACMILGKSFDIIEEDDKALMWYKKAQSLGHPDAALSIARSYVTKQDIRSAQKWYETILETGPNPIALLELNALMLLDSRTRDQALEVIHGLAEENITPACELLGQYYHDNEDEENAEKWFERTAQTDSCDMDTYYNIASFYDDIDNNDKYRFFLEKSAELNDPRAEFEMAHILMNEEKFEESMEYLSSSAIKRFPPALILMGSICEEEGKFDMARDFYMVAAEQNEPEAMHSLALLHWEHGDIHEAIRWCEMAVELGHEESADLIKKLYASHTCSHHH